MLHDKGLSAERERRARLASERMAAKRERELTEKIARLEETSRRLNREIAEKRQDARRPIEAAPLPPPTPQGGAAPDQMILWAAVQTLANGFAIWGADDHLVIANDAYFRFLGEIDEIRPGISYRRMLEILVEEGVADTGGDDPASWVSRMVSTIRGDSVPDRLVRHWDGRFLRVTSQRLSTGGFVTLVMDQSDMIRLSTAIESLPDGFVMTDAADRVVLSNAEFRSAYVGAGVALPTGTQFADILRRGLARGLFPAAKDREEDWLDQWLDRRADAEPVEERLANGRWIRALDVELPDGGHVGFHLDITDAKTQQLELERLAEAAEAAARAKAAFLSNMSHEIRTPMNGLVGMADMLLETNLDSDQKEMLGTLRSSAGGLMSLLDGVLEFSRAEAGQIDLAIAPFDAAALLRDVAEVFRAEAAQRGLALDIYCPPLPECVGDARRLRQVLAILLGNAVKFTDSGGVTVRCAVDGGDLRIAVQDTGPGIPDHRAATIFEGFVQGEDGADRSHDGSGLGLAICRKLVERMDGSIVYRPRDCGGSIFEVTLPVSSEADAAPVPRMLRILAAEDNATNRLVLKKLLEPFEAEITMVERAEDCLAQIRSQRPDLLLTDISMPDMDGCEMTRRIRAQERDAGASPLRIVAMTAHAHPTDTQRMHDAGIDRVLTKPLSRAVLAEEVEAATAGLAETT